MTDIQGVCPPQFDAVRRAFEGNFEDGGELGARFSLAVDGEVVVDLYGGWADRRETKPFGPDTLTPVFSTTKAIASILIARLVEQGKLAYTQRVAEVWPEFAQAGKEAVTVEQVMSHQVGLPGFPDEMDQELWFDWDAICAKLAEMKPMWPVGSASGYHPVTFGYLAGEIFRRVDGRTMGTALREDIAVPASLDLWIGLPDAEHGRVAELKRPAELPKFGELNDAVKAAFLTPWASPGGRSGADWRRMEIPSANGHATAPSLALLMAALATDGETGGLHILSPQVRDEAARERIRGRDLVLPFEMSWGAGFMRNAPNMMFGPGQQTFGHTGWGGSCAFADPERRVSGAYVMNKQSAELIGDARSRRLIDAAYSAL
jgi:CubicO group peptidase (beta-lactamase class C family)